MAATYTQFLASPNSSLLADKATLHYVTSTTSFAGSAAIIKHLNTLQKQVSKKKEEVLNLVDGQNTIALEVATALEFQTSGGAYLPGLDDNFLSDRVAYLSITHFVTFDAQRKITQIRLQWDQGSLLKQLDIIGKSGRNWPIRDSREQLNLIQSALKSIGAGGPVGAPQSQNEVTIRTRGNSTNALRDPHASLHLMGSREEIEAQAAAAVVSPYAGNRPQQRSFTDILGDEPEGPSSPTSTRKRAMSPTKSGSGKNFQPMRLFEGQEEEEEENARTGRASEKQYIRPNPSKYNHFDFADGSDPQDRPERGLDLDERPKSKHDSQWSFNDFTTPAKAKATKTVRAQDVRHWDTDKDTLGEAPTEAQGKGRRDAETHFELQDDGERAEADRPGRPRGSTQNEGLGLYKDQVIANEDEEADPNRPLGNITNLGHRGKDFDPHFAMEDKSPSQARSQEHVPETKKKAIKMMDSNWSAYDQSPVSQKENKPKAKPKTQGFLDEQRINIAGDGMGGRKGTERDWLYGEVDDQVPKPTGRKGGQGAPASKDKSFWDF